MNQPSTQTRRDLMRQAATAAAVAGSLDAVSHRASAELASSRSLPKSRIRIGTRISPPWLDGPNDAHLKFLKQIGVDYVDIELIMVQGYKDTGRFTKAALRGLIDRFAGEGLQIERAKALGPYVVNASFGTEV